MNDLKRGHFHERLQSSMYALQVVVLQLNGLGTESPSGRPQEVEHCQLVKRNPGAILAVIFPCSSIHSSFSLPPYFHLSFFVSFARTDVDLFGSYGTSMSRHYRCTRSGATRVQKSIYPSCHIDPLAW